MKSSKKITRLKVFRFNPSKDKEPHYQTYEVTLGYENMSVLGLLVHIYENLDSSLGFLYSCSRTSEQGRCGACDMFIDGKGAQACTFIAEEGEILVEPPVIIGFPVIKDLICRQFSLADREIFFLPRVTASQRFRNAYNRTKAQKGEYDE